ncbi:microcystin-dependent protein [Mucilaginibacter yixingensis]|uniref:Microcystin-dependent protein n=1 Tax=Mucilaginibacter yixingensis TaxID=1295612 RepID=A0A2T5JG59_9SPHI|nr:tail fiber protein [Mucilaginibacter yixingensis]PTR01413.1 microcystin-dependent protein [Mucilaginibacter yixingensis]
MDQYLAIIIQWAGNFAPTQFALCSGQILPISQNTALFSLLGTNYGGNGTSNFGLPDLRGRIPVGQGQGTGLSPYVVGEQTGSESVSLLSSNLPLHSHNVNVYAGVGNQSTPSNSYLAEGPKSGTGPSAKSPNIYYNGAAPNTTLNPLSISTNVGGGGLPMSILQPTITVSYIIALAGIFPPRN